MIFTDLAPIQQIAIVIDLADLNDEPSNTVNDASDELKTLNLKRSPEQIRSREQEHVFVNPQQDNYSASSTLQFSINPARHTPNPLCLTVTQRMSSEITPELSLSRNGLSIDFKLTGDLQVALSKIRTIVEGIEVMVGNTNDSSVALSKLVAAFDVAMTLPEHIITPYYVNDNLSRLLEVTHRVLSRDVSDKYTQSSASASPPVFTTVANYGRTISVTCSSNKFKLLLKLGATDPNDVILSYKFGNHTYIDISTYPGTYTENHALYLNNLTKWIRTAVPSEYEQPELVTLTEFLSDVMKNTIPFILKEVDIDKEIEQHKHNPDHMCQPWI